MRPALLTTASIASIASIALAGCAASSSRSDAALPRNRAPPGSEVLVWSADERGASTLRVQGGGRIVETLPGIRVATTRGEWRWTTRPVPIATEKCEPPVAAPAGTGHLTYAAFTRDGEAQVLLDPRPDAGVNGANELEDEVRLVATVGPLAFVEHVTRVYACGAHGREDHGFVVWDLEAGGPVDLLTRVVDPGSVVARALPLLDEGAATAEEAPRITELLPVLRGTDVRFLAQVTVPACFACSDGLWSSYTRSARVETPAPRGVDPRLPPAVLELVPRYGNREIRGWSVVPERMRPSVLTEP